MKSISILCISCFMYLISSSLHAETNTWKGGTPGDETNWMNPRNWCANTVPTEISDVVIPNISTTGSHYPIVKSKVEPIGSLLISGGAKLFIEESGLLIVDGREVYNYGILNLGYILINGEVFIENCALDPYLGDKTQHTCFVTNQLGACNHFQLVNVRERDPSNFLLVGRRFFDSN